MPFVVSSKRERGELQRPDPVIDFFKGDGFPREGDRDKQGRALPADQAVLIDATNFGMTRILQRGQLSRHRPPRRLVTRRWDGLAQRFVGSLMVVLGAEASK